MGFFKEFREFAIRGSVIDLAIGVVIGAAFNKIVSSLIDDIITPLVLKPVMDADKLNRLEDLKILGTVKYGTFLAAVINFFLVALVLFLIIKAINAIRKKEAAPAPEASSAISNEEKLLTEIRDLLKQKNR